MSTKTPGERATAQIAPRVSPHICLPKKPCIPIKRAQWLWNTLLPHLQQVQQKVQQKVQQQVQQHEVMPRIAQSACMSTKKALHSNQKSPESICVYRVLYFCHNACSTCNSTNCAESESTYMSTQRALYSYQKRPKSIYVHEKACTFLSKEPYIPVPVKRALYTCSCQKSPIYLFLSKKPYIPVPVKKALHTCSCQKSPTYLFLSNEPFTTPAQHTPAQSNDTHRRVCIYVYQKCSIFLP